MNFTTIDFKIKGASAWITLNRPKVMNVMNSVMQDELIYALDIAAGNFDVRVLVLTGAGDKAFCAGADLNELLNTINAPVIGEQDFLDKFDILFEKLRAFPKPVIAALNGLTCAGGLELTMGCDLVIAAESATIGDCHANFGVIPGGGGAAVLMRKMSPNQAKYLMFTGDLVSAYEMKSYGLVNEVVPAEQLPTAVDRLVEKLIAKSPLMLERVKALANTALDQGQEAALRHEMLSLRQHMRSHDMLEGLLAFNEKRQPKFEGR